jgi:hypothetical protein
MAQEIRGSTDESTRMILGQIREVFDPHWIQAFEGRGFTVQFQHEPDAEEELVNFANMYGFSLEKYREEVWSRYYFR